MLFRYIVALLMAAVSLYYYFKVIIAMYFKNGHAEMYSEVTVADKILLGTTALLVILVGIAPGLFLL